DGNTLLSAGTDGTLRAWNTDWGAVEHRYHNLGLSDLATLSVSPDQSSALVASSSGVIRFDLASEAVLNTWSEEGGANAVAYSPNGNFAVFGGAQVVLGAFSDGQTTPLPWGEPSASPTVLAVQFSADGKYVYALTTTNGSDGARGGTLWKWDAAT